MQEDRQSGQNPCLATLVQNVQRRTVVDPLRYPLKRLKAAAQIAIVAPSLTAAYGYIKGELQHVADIRRQSRTRLHTAFAFETQHVGS